MKRRYVASLTSPRHTLMFLFPFLCTDPLCRLLWASRGYFVFACSWLSVAISCFVAFRVYFVFVTVLLLHRRSSPFISAYAFALLLRLLSCCCLRLLGRFCRCLLGCCFCCCCLIGCFCFCCCCFCCCCCYPLLLMLLMLLLFCCRCLLGCCFCCCLIGCFCFCCCCYPLLLLLSAAADAASAAAFLLPLPSRLLLLLLPCCWCCFFAAYLLPCDCLSSVPCVTINRSYCLSSALHNPRCRVNFFFLTSTHVLLYNMAHH